ncbi:putative kinase [Actinoalloteichus hoggarensis]|uniref:Chloramphenicol phosphotransferase-like protein n=1 Tax=Actinoalloteichus hoggarensis TaxID=1470176 RepID=A0A221W4D5_9PSEU|nr:AAA family ATPase [Actinoalloteichus hoggarensis]ASO20437.1 Chloramphenicol phosphotransferase-like protein [Actinoalloteichus hoggarensis]MBB5923476.1 putative kinase [Actinoalloteichus hoggarensis]
MTLGSAEPGPLERGTPAVILITGVQAAGKSTVAQLLAERLPHAVHLRGDLFRRMIVSGRHEMTPDAEPAALEQLRLRHRLTASVADEYVRAGFTVVAQDVVLGEELPRLLAAVHSRPVFVVVLAPDVAAIARREEGRPKNAYGPAWSPEDLDRLFRAETPRLGLWLDTTHQTPEETVEEILTRVWTEAGVDPAPEQR